MENRSDHTYNRDMTRRVPHARAWDLAISLSGGAYVIASLIRGLQSPAFGVAVVGAAAIRLLVALDRGHQPRSG